MTNEKKTTVDHLMGQRVRVYRNLHRGCFSVQTYATGRGWRVEAHVKDLILSDVEFKVMENGRQKVLRERKKNVHAFAIGTVRLDKPVLDDYRMVGYNPYKFDSFVYLATQRNHKAVYKARYAHLYITATEGKTLINIDPIIEDTVLTN